MTLAHSANLQPSRLRRWLREPLLIFLLGGFVLFASYNALNPQTGTRLPAKQIQLSAGELQQLTQAWEARWQRPPTATEMHSLIEDRVRDEVLYREALALGLDQGDTIVKRRLAQKMEFLAEDTSALREPTAGELEAWFNQHREQVAQPGRLSFRHRYFSPDQHGGQTREVAVKALQQLAGKPADSPVAANSGDRFMFQDNYADQAPEQVASVFGGKFAQAAFRLQPGTWQGPIESGLGWHLVFVETVAPQRVPAFEEIAPQVKAEWIGQQRDDAKRTLYATLRERYEILLPAADAVAQQAASMSEPKVAN
jgi:peptidyl-prolyl cis-trans isomerase C